jgi:peptide/nickel transport system permease protein
VNQDTGRYVLRRLALALPLLLVITLLVFALIHLAPGTPEQALAGPRRVSEETLAAIRDRYNLDEPFLVQYVLWLKAAVTGDFGRSLQSQESVTSAIRTRLGITAFLGLYATVMALAVGIPLGLWAAYRRGTRTDRAVVGVSVLGVSAPTFAIALVLIYLFSVRFEWFPKFGGGEGFVDRAYHLTLPAIALALGLVALIVKITRAAAIDVLEQDYVAFARARGLSSGHIARRYVLRNSLIPVVTAAGLIVVGLFGGAVLVEVIFGLPGLGTLLDDSVSNQDIPVVQALVLFTAVFVIGVNLALDVLYTVIDPRIRIGSVQS